jgi:hypothetical protein
MHCAHSGRQDDNFDKVVDDGDNDSGCDGGSSADEKAEDEEEDDEYIGCSIGAGQLIQQLGLPKHSSH